MNLAQFGGRLRQAREAAHLTQEDVVNRLGRKDITAISEYENGKRRLAAYELPDYARALGVSVASLFEDLPTDDALDVALLDWFKQLPYDKRQWAYKYIIQTVPIVIGLDHRHTLNDERSNYDSGTKRKR